MQGHVKYCSTSWKNNASCGGEVASALWVVGYTLVYMLVQYTMKIAATTCAFCELLQNKRSHLQSSSWPNGIAFLFTNIYFCSANVDNLSRNKNMVAQEVARIAQGYWTALLLHPLAGPWDTCKEGTSQLMWQCGFEFLLSDILVVFFFNVQYCGIIWPFFSALQVYSSSATLK